MKIRNTLLAALFVTALAPALAARAAEDLKAEVQQTINAMKQKDPTIEKFFLDSAGYAVFPGVGEGGFIVGGAHGKGLVYEKGQLIGQATVSKGTVGAQVGGQSFSEVIFFQTPETLQEFKKNKLEMSAGVSAVAAAEGAAQTAGYQQGVAVFTLPKKGLMAKAAVGGQKFKFEPLK